MTDIEERLKRIEREVEAHFKDRKEEFVPGETTIGLSRPTFGADEVMEVIDSLLSTWVTMGEKVTEFEQLWAEYVGADHSVMVNSGSSANLVAMKALSRDRISPGDEVIVPAVSWSTSVFPIVDVGATPVLVDVDPETYTIDPDALQDAITDETAAIVPVHLLGNPCEMDYISDLAETHDLSVMEDCCEAHGATYQGQKVGTFGDFGTFSFFFSHHISTIEGGAVVTDSAQDRDELRMYRAHGWTRETEEQDYATEYPSLDDRFLFARHGYNLRPTEIQGGFGIHQVPKLDRFIDERRRNAQILNRQLERHVDYFELLRERDGTRCSWFAYPILIRPDAPFSRAELQNHLESNQIETRPILAGDITKQPAMEEIPHQISGDLSGAEHLHFDGLFVGNHHGLTDEKLTYIIDTIDEFIKQFG